MDIAALSAAWISNHIPFNPHTSQPLHITEEALGYVDWKGKPAAREPEE